MKILSIFAGASLALVAATTTQADTIRATSGFGPSHVLATDVYPKLFEKLSEFTAGRWNGEDTSSGLVAPNEMNAGLRDGITELGAMILPYFAADYPESTLPMELAVLGKDPRAISAAVTEYIVNCADCLAEFTENGQVYLGTDSTTPYNFLSTKPIRTAADVNGMRIRSGGPIFARIIESLGGVAVQMPASEQFEGLSQGTLDATYASTPDLINVRLVDVVKYVTNIETGVFNGAAVVNASALLWTRMSDEDRTALVKAAQYGLAADSGAWQRNAAKGVEEGTAKGIEFITPDETLQAAIDGFIENHMATVADTLSGRGVKDAAAKVAQYKALVDKWEGLVAGVSSEDEIAELRYNEIWANVDVASYGQ